MKPLEQDSNHLRQIGNVSAALVYVEERQTQAAGGTRVGEEMLQMHKMEGHFCQGDGKIKMKIFKVRNSKCRQPLQIMRWDI